MFLNKQFYMYCLSQHSAYFPFLIIFVQKNSEKCLMIIWDWHSKPLEDSVIPEGQWQDAVFPPVINMKNDININLSP